MKSKQPTPKELKIMEAISRGYLTPTDIGQECGKRYHEASSWACKSLNSLVQKGYISKIAEGAYDLTREGTKLIVGQLKLRRTDYEWKGTE